MNVLQVSILTLSVLFLACKSESSDPEITGEVAKLSVLNVSQKSIPNQLQIDGLLAGKNIVNIASAGEVSTYEQIQPGVRNFSLGNYKDTIHIEGGNFYTLMIYDNDSTTLNYDGSFHHNQFNKIQELKWNITGDDPARYTADIYADSLIRNIKSNTYTALSAANNTYRLDLYRIGNPLKIGSKEVVVKLNQKAIFNVKYDPVKEEYDFTTILQHKE